MTLQASGAITLADIQTEFGGANPISLSEYYAGGGLVPAGTGSIPTSGLISIGTFYGTSSAPEYWIITTPVYTDDASCRDFSFDSTPSSDGKLYIVGQPGYVNSYGTLNGWFLTKTQQKALTIESTIVVDSNNGGGAYVLTDSSNNVFVAHTNLVTVNGVSVTGISLTKYNSSGAFQWGKTIGSSIIVGAKAYIAGLVFDSSGNIYIAGSINYNSNVVVAKYNSSGTLQWLNVVGATSTYNMQITNNRSLSIDSSNNLYLSLLAYTSSNSQYRPVTISFTDAGVIIASRRIISFGGVANGAPTHGGQVISPGYRHTASSLALATSYADLIYELWSNVETPALQNRSCLSAGTGGRLYVCSISKDSSNNIYIAANFTTGASVGQPADTSYGVLVKYSMWGTLQWQRKFTTTAGAAIVLTGVNVDSPTTLIVTGRRATTAFNGGTALTMRLPIDGSKTGTYGNYIYSASSFAFGSGSPTTVGTASPTLTTVPSTTQSIDTTITVNTTKILTPTITGI